MSQIDRSDAENSLEDMARQQDKFLMAPNSFYVKDNDKYTRSVQSSVNWGVLNLGKFRSIQNTA